MTLSEIDDEKLAQGKNGRYYADLYAQEHCPYHRWILLGLGILIIGLVLLAGGAWSRCDLGRLPFEQQTSQLITSQTLGIGGIAFLIAGLPLLWLGRRRRNCPPRIVWAECKDLNRPVSVSDVKKLVTDVDDVLQNDSASWKPDIVMMFARGGYVEDASRVATDPTYQTVKQCEIRLYRQRGKKPNAFDLVLFKR